MAKKTKFNRIITHRKPHFDEIVAIWLLYMFGEAEFPGVKEAELEFWDMGGDTPDGRSATEWEEDGSVLVGVGHGQFDEHPFLGKELGEEEECAATLVAKKLGIRDEPALAKILQYTLRSDRHAGQEPFGIASLVKVAHLYSSLDAIEVIESVSFFLKAVYAEQRKFFEAQAELTKDAVMERIPGPNGRELTLVSVESDNAQASKAARFEGADIVVVRKSTGHTGIFVDTKSGLVLHEVAKVLRREEANARGERGRIEWSDLSQFGMFQGWFFHDKAKMLLNGSDTATGVEPTKLTVEKIRECVKIGVGTKVFFPARSVRCEKGFCSSTMSNQCPWFHYGLRRCSYDVRRSQQR
jgi:hypothetical protein